MQTGKKKKVVFLASQALEKVFRLMYGNICLNYFYRAILITGNSGVSDSGVGLKKKLLNPNFLPGPITASPSPPGTPHLVCPPHQGLGASSPV